MMRYVRAIFVPLALLVVGMVRLLARFGILVRFGTFISYRIGHLVGNTECWLCERDAGMQKGIIIWTHQGHHANRYLSRKFNKCMWVDVTRFTLLVRLVNKLFLGWEKHVSEPAQYDRDIHNLFEKQPPHLKITPAEERRGLKLLRRMGIPEGAKWVCLIVRDAAYLKRYAPQLGYHDYRDTDIGSYIPAAIALAKRGYYVIRMGHIVEKPLLVKHTHIIDYATNGMRSEFGDYYLGAKCAFCISTGTGFDAIPYVFRRPLCYVNMVPLEYLFTFARNSLAIWKHHVKDGKRMQPKDIFLCGASQFTFGHLFAQEGIALESNSMQEITDVVIEMAENLDIKERRRLRRYHGTTLSEMLDISDVNRQVLFWSIFPRNISPYNHHVLHGEFRMQIGREFLKGYL